MLNHTLINDWTLLRQWLPSDLNALAVHYGFFQRARGLIDAEVWLRLILLHVSGGLSLEQTVLRARELGWAQVSAMALFKRLRRAEPWLQALSQHLLEEHQQHVGRGHWPSAYSVRVIDATDIQEPGSVGTAWRLHYSIRLPELTCDHYQLTDTHQGEKLGRFHFRPGELVLVDRGYCHWAGAAQVLESGAQLLLRLNPRLFPLRGMEGNPFNVLEHVRRLSKGTAAEWQVQFNYHGRTYRLRLCAVRLNPVAAQRARQRMQRKARTNGERRSAQSLELAGYVLVVSSLPSCFSASQVLALYRCRWQVELSFKRLKSLLAAGYVPKSTDASARAWMQGKLLTALLLERLLWEAGIFSLGATFLREPESMALGPGSTGYLSAGAGSGAEGVDVSAARLSHRSGLQGTPAPSAFTIRKSKSNLNPLGLCLWGPDP